MPPTHPLLASRFDTRLIADRNRFERWRESMAPIFELSPMAGFDPDQFAAGATVYHLGELLLAEAWSQGPSLWQGAKPCKRATPDLLLLQLQTTGQGLALSGCLDLPIQPGTLTLVDLKEPYLSEDDGFRCLNLIVPLATLAPRLNAPIPPGGLSLTTHQALGRILAGHLEAVWDALPILRPTELGVVVNGLLMAVADAFTPAETDAAGGTCPRTAALLHEIDQHLHEPLDIEWLCQRFGYSRSSLYRLFRPYAGISAYVRRRRLTGSYRDLRSPFTVNRSLAEIAQRWGFSDQSHFSHQFRRIYGLSPSQVRERALDTIDSRRGTRTAHLDLPNYRDWLETL